LASATRASLREEPDRVGELEVAAAAPEDLGEREDLRAGIVATHRAPHLGGAQDAELHAEAAEHAHEGSREVLAIEPPVAPERLGSLLQLGEVVAVALDEVRDLLRGKVRRVEAGHLAVGERRGEGVRRLAGGAVRVVEGEHRARRRRRRGAQVAHLRVRHVVRVEHRIAEDLHEVGDDARVIVRRERLEIEVQDLREPDEQGGGEAPPIVLDEVQVAR
jgi:hypothetical protein